MTEKIKAQVIENLKNMEAANQFEREFGPIERFVENNPRVAQQIAFGCACSYGFKNNGPASGTIYLNTYFEKGKLVYKTRNEAPSNENYKNFRLELSRDNNGKKEVLQSASGQDMQIKVAMPKAGNYLITSDAVKKALFEKNPNLPFEKSVYDSKSKQTKKVTDYPYVNECVRIASIDRRQWNDKEKKFETVMDEKNGKPINDAYYINRNPDGTLSATRNDYARMFFYKAQRDEKNNIVRDPRFDRIQFETETIKVTDKQGKTVEKEVPVLLEKKIYDHVLTREEAESLLSCQHLVLECHDKENKAFLVSVQFNPNNPDGNFYAISHPTSLKLPLETVEKYGLDYFAENGIAVQIEPKKKEEAAEIKSEVKKTTKKQEKPSEEKAETKKTTRSTEKKPAEKKPKGAKKSI